MPESWAAAGSGTARTAVTKSGHSGGAGGRSPTTCAGTCIVRIAKGPRRALHSCKLTSYQVKDRTGVVGMQALKPAYDQPCRHRVWPCLPNSPEPDFNVCQHPCGATCILTVPQCNFTVASHRYRAWCPNGPVTGAFVIFCPGRCGMCFIRDGSCGCQYWRPIATVATRPPQAQTAIPDVRHDVQQRHRLHEHH